MTDKMPVLPNDLAAKAVNFTDFLADPEKVVPTITPGCGLMLEFPTDNGRTMALQFLLECNANIAPPGTLKHYALSDQITCQNGCCKKHKLVLVFDSLDTARAVSDNPLTKAAYERIIGDLGGRAVTMRKNMHTGEVEIDPAQLGELLAKLLGGGAAKVEVVGLSDLIKAANEDEDDATPRLH